MAEDHDWSEELYRIFEFDPATKVTVQPIRELIHPEDLPSFDAEFGRSTKGADFDLVFRIVPRGRTTSSICMPSPTSSSRSRVDRCSSALFRT